MAIRPPVPREAEMSVLEVETEQPTDQVGDQELIQKVGEEEQAFDQMMTAFAPEGEYSEQALGTITQSINEVLKLFGPMAEPVVAQPAEGFLPTNITAAISMISLSAGS